MEGDLFQGEDGASGGGSGWYVSRGELAELLGLSTQMINKLEKDGMPKHSRNRYHAPKCVQWYVGTWKHRAAAAGSADSPDAQRYQSARAARAELELKEYASRLVDADLTVEAFNKLAAIFVSALDNLPSRFAAELAALNSPSEIEEILDNERRRIRHVVSDNVTAFAGTLDGRGNTQASA